MLRIVSIREDFFEDHHLHEIDDQFLDNTEHGRNRPYVIILTLRFRGVKQDFAIPFRSNIKGHVPKDTYFSLPPRKETKPHHIHGLHFIKMFPVDKSYFLKYHYPTNNKSADITKQILTKNFKRLVTAAQSYLDRFEEGNRPRFCIDIGKVYDAIHKSKAVAAVGSTKENDNA